MSSSAVFASPSPVLRAIALAHPSPSALSLNETSFFESSSRFRSAPFGRDEAFATPAPLAFATTAVTTSGPSLGPSPFSSTPSSTSSVTPCPYARWGSGESAMASLPPIDAAAPTA